MGIQGQELDALRKQYEGSGGGVEREARPRRSSSASQDEIQALRDQVASLTERVAALEQRLGDA